MNNEILSPPSPQEAITTLDKMLKNLQDVMASFMLASPTMSTDKARRIAEDMNAQQWALKHAKAAVKYCMDENVQPVYSDANSANSAIEGNANE